MIREETVGEMHMDTALLYNNLGCCYDMLNRVTEAVESFQKAKDVFSYGVCVCVRACVCVCVCMCDLGFCEALTTHSEHRHRVRPDAPAHVVGVAESVAHPPTPARLFCQI